MADRICFLIRSLDIGGAERQLLELARGLSSRGAKVTVVTFYPDGNPYSGLQTTGVSVVSLNKRGRWDVFAFCWRLLKTIRAMRPDVLYSFLPTANLLSALLRYLGGVRSVVWGVRASSLDLASYGWLVRVETQLAAPFARLADLIICNSLAGMEDAAKQGYPIRKMHVVYNGIDTRTFRFDADARMRLRTEWAVAAEEFLIGIVARVDPMKGHEDFIRAAAILAAELPQVRFVCVGGGAQSLESRLRHLVSELGLGERLRWVGPRADAPAIYSALDVLSSTSRYGEGFSNTVAEGMACERPCVVTDVGDSRRVVSGCGWVVPPRDHVALAAAWRTVIALPAAERVVQGRAARQRVEQAFGVTRMVDETVRLLGLSAVSAT